MFFTFLVFLSAFLLEGIGTYVSVVGLGHLFAYSPVVMIMAVALDVAKVVNVTFLYRHWKEIGWTMKSYLLSATLVLMMITSTGVFGYLSGEFQKAISGNTQQTVVIQSLVEEQGRLQKRKEEIDKQVAQLPQNNVRGRRQLMQQFGPEVTRLNERLATIDKQLPELKVANIQKETHVGPIMYVAEAFKTTPAEAVKWIIFTIIFVFDPLAVALLIAGNFLFMRNKKPKYEPDDGPLTKEQLEQVKQLAEESGVTQDRVATSTLFPPETPADLDEGNFWSDTAGDDRVDHDGAMAAIMSTPHLREHLENNPPPWVTETKPKRKYVRKPPAVPAREMVVIKAPPPPVPKPPKVVVSTQGEKEVIKIEKTPMPTSLDKIRAPADFTEDGTKSKTAGMYKDE